MKKLLLFSAALAVAGGAAAQQAEFTRQVAPSRQAIRSFPTEESAAKTAGLSDTGFYTLSLYIPKNTSNIYTRQIFDTSTGARVDRAFPLDSGFYFGLNRFQNRGYAEQMYFRYKPDTTLRILGVRTLFNGRVQITSTKALTFAIWRKGAESAAGVKKFNEGLPTIPLVQTVIAASRIGVNANTGFDTFKNFFFTAPLALAAQDSDFYVGYTMPAYTWTALAADTFGMRSSRGGYGFGVGSYLRGNGNLDTIHGNQNVYMTSAGAWRDNYWDYGLNRNLSIIPIVQLNSANINSIGDGLTRGGLTFAGNFPNPASTNTTIRFAIARAAEVSVEISDMAGRVLRRQSAGKLGAGEHNLPISVADLPAGNYVYMLTTSEGDAMAAQMTVVR